MSVALQPLDIAGQNLGGAAPRSWHFEPTEYELDVFTVRVIVKSPILCVYPQHIIFGPKEMFAR